MLGEAERGLSTFLLPFYIQLLSNKNRKDTKGSFFTAQWGIDVSEEGDTAWTKVWKLETIKEKVVIGSK